MEAVDGGTIAHRLQGIDPGIPALGYRTVPVARQGLVEGWTGRAGRRQAGSCGG
ncbi:hypothetical protein D187_003570 [Cystobacter fuscus DSM 2262]|uniref:Uncharacterized protein n=1 Tax=Cystobacter fuscus (strain ATCC 25194 / DSM 2262 / NBRC 100088 / M29) TaxID=1242864 RepID=S9P307_CYSF2|nr:hypothetical protein D187_003570 [Cystobacter fuscus DSM 2262]